MKTRIASAADSFWDDPLEPARLAELMDLDFLVLHYLTGSAWVHLVGPPAGAARSVIHERFLRAVLGLCPALFLQGDLRIVTDAGAADSQSAARDAAGILLENGSGHLQVAAVVGDRLVDQLEELLAAGCPLKHLETGQSFFHLRRPIVAAYAHLGCEPIRSALAQGARLVIAGPVAPPALTAGSAWHAQGWSHWSLEKLATAVLAGCILSGGQAVPCGGDRAAGFTATGPSDGSEREEWMLRDPGRAVVEFDAAGEAAIEWTGVERFDKVQASARGAVQRVERLIRGLRDKGALLTPDVQVDLARLALEPTTTGGVRLENVSGRPAPPHYDVTIVYQAGHTTSVELSVPGDDDASSKAQWLQARWTEQLRQSTHVEWFGGRLMMPVTLPPESRAAAISTSPASAVRFDARDPQPSALEQFVQRAYGLIRQAPFEVVAAHSDWPEIKPLFERWPTTVPQKAIEASAVVRTAERWAND